MKKAIIILFINVFLLIVVSFTYAFLTKVYSKSNGFVLGTVVPQIRETFVSGERLKENVKVKNNGNIDVYVRVALVFSFEDNNGVVLSEEPLVDEDYTISFSSSTNWILGSDGFYYYKNKISPNDETDVLINSCRGIKSYTDRSFNLDIVVQAIQADPSRAVTDAWGVSVVNNVLTP